MKYIIKIQSFVTPYIVAASTMESIKWHILHLAVFGEDRNNQCLPLSEEPGERFEVSE